MTTHAIHATALLAAVPAFAEYPEKDITPIVPWSSGVGTDTVARTLVAEVEHCFGTGVNVVNCILAAYLVAVPVMAQEGIGSITGTFDPALTRGS